MRKLNKGEVAIVFTPMEDSEGNWDGSLTTGIAFGSEYLPDGMRAGLDMAITLSAAPAMLEDYEDVEELLMSYKAELLQEAFPEQWAQAEQEVAQESATEGNSKVVQLGAWTKTMGSA